MYLIFIVLIIISYWGIKFVVKNEDTQKLYFCILSFIVLLFLHFFKNNNVYPDLGNYSIEFNGINYIGNFKEFLILYTGNVGHFHEIGWSVLNYLISRITSDYFIFLKVVSFLICSGYSYGIYKMSKQPLFSFLFMMTYHTITPYSFFVLRQQLAIATIIISLALLYENRYKSSFLCFIIAATFHYSAVVLAPIFVLYYWKGDIFTFKKIIFCIAIAAGFTYLLNNITYERYMHYTESSSNTLAFMLTGFIFIVSRLLIYSNKSIISDGTEPALLGNGKLMMSLTYFSALICLMSMGTGVGRLTNYFTSLLIVTVPYFIQRCSIVFKVGIYSAYLAVSVLLIITTINLSENITKYEIVLKWFEY